MTKFVFTRAECAMVFRQYVADEATNLTPEQRARLAIRAVGLDAVLKAIDAERIKHRAILSEV